MITKVGDSGELGDTPRLFKRRNLLLFSSFSSRLFAMNGSSGWLGGQGCLPAAIMALDDVNNNEDLLPGYYLNLTWSNSQVSVWF